MKLKQKHLWIFLTIVIVVVFFGVLYDVGDEKDTSSSETPQRPMIHHDTTTNTIYGLVLYEGVGPTDEEFKELLVQHLNKNGITELGIDNITITSRNIEGNYEEINIQINCTDCKITETFNIVLGRDVTTGGYSGQCPENAAYCNWSLVGNQHQLSYFLKPRDTLNYDLGPDAGEVIIGVKDDTRDNYPHTLQLETLGGGTNVNVQCNSNTSTPAGVCLDNTTGNLLPLTVDGKSQSYWDPNGDDILKAQRRCTHGDYCSAQDPAIADNVTTCNGHMNDPSGCGNNPLCHHTDNPVETLNVWIDPQNPKAVAISPDQITFELFGCAGNCEDLEPPDADAVLHGHSPVTWIPPQSVGQLTASQLNFFADGYGIVECPTLFMPSATLEDGVPDSRSIQRCFSPGTPLLPPTEQVCVPMCTYIETPGYVRLRDVTLSNNLLRPQNSFSPPVAAMGKNPQGSTVSAINCDSHYTSSPLGEDVKVTPCTISNHDLKPTGCVQSCEKPIHQIYPVGAVSDAVNNDDLVTKINSLVDTTGELSLDAVPLSTDCPPNWENINGTDQADYLTCNPPDRAAAGRAGYTFQFNGCFPPCPDVNADTECINFQLKVNADIGGGIIADDMFDELLPNDNAVTHTPGIAGWDLTGITGGTFVKGHILHIKDHAGIPYGRNVNLDDITYYRKTLSNGEYTIEYQIKCGPGCQILTEGGDEGAGAGDRNRATSPTWHLGDVERESCDVVCRGAGAGTCVAGSWGLVGTNATRDEYIADLDASLTMAGHNPSDVCGSYGSSNTSTTPSLQTDNTTPGYCMYHTDADGNSPQTCSSPSGSGYRRLCQCLLGGGAQAPPPPTPSPPPSPPPPGCLSSWRRQHRRLEPIIRWALGPLEPL